VITRLIVGGAQENTVATVGFLHRRGIRCELLTGCETGPEGDIFDEAHATGALVRTMPELVREVQPLKDIRALFGLVRLMRRGRYTIVHTHSSKGGIIGRLAARLAGVPIVIHTVHGYAFNQYHSAFERQVYRWLEWLCGRLTDHIIVISRPLLERTLRNRIASSPRLSVIHSGIDVQQYAGERDHRAARQIVGAPANARVLGCVARLVEGKGHDDLLRAFALVHAQRPDTHLVLVGDGPLRSELEQQARDSGIAGAVTFLGLRRDVPQLLPAFDVFILMSLWEGMGRVLLEAMASGCPVVATRVDGIIDLVEDGANGILVEPRDAEGAAAALVRLLDDPALHARLVESGRRFVGEQYSAERMCADILALYERLLAQPGAGTRDPQPAGHR
jgi:glycosyltransferase involved in cell wall biosynthesis